MDRIVVLYETPPIAERARTRLGQEGFASDRLDVVSRADGGRVVNQPTQSTEDDLIDYFTVLLDDETDRPVIESIVDAIQGGKAVLVVHPRGKIEIEQAQRIIASHSPETVIWRVAPAESQGGLLGEHAAGFKA